MTEKQCVEYKDTLNLVKTTLEMRANAAKKELETQKFWEENKIYEKILQKNPKTNKFILHDGPPYLSSERIHIGTALNKILKDIVIRYKSQTGFYAPYVPGYDGHSRCLQHCVGRVVCGGIPVGTGGRCGGNGSRPDHRRGDPADLFCPSQPQSAPAWPVQL